MIRMQNRSDRNECRERERFLYGYSGRTEQPKELYGAEMSVALEGYTEKKPSKGAAKEASLLSGFRMRFFIAVAVMALFIYMDKSGGKLFGKTMEELTFYLTDSIRLEETFGETLNLFDL